MKTYIFLNNSIRQMGGAQMYIRNKMLALEKEGWHVEVFYFLEGKILIPELKKFKDNRIENLRFPIFSLSENARKQVLNIISNRVTKSDDVVIESVTFGFRHWGELIAEHLSGLNLLFFVNETYPKLSKAEEDYLLWKQKRGEYLNHISVKKKASIRVASEHNDKYEFIMTPYNNVVSPESINFEFDKSLPVITSIGRLEKNYILKMVLEVIKFAEENDTKVNLFFIGGASEKGYIDNIKAELSKTNMVIPHFFGYLFPIPVNILDVTDVVIAVSGSVLVGVSRNIPTISIDVNDSYPLGVFGHTTHSRLFRSNEAIVPTSEILKDIILDNKYKEAVNYIDPDVDVINRHNSDLINKLLNNNKVYYNVMEISSFKDKLSYYMKSSLRNIIGDAKIEKIRRRIFG
ncbi:hypothetical protein HMPREF1062_03455 [Bacteroides cellulosilyticus CL02T12C19]|uniref:Glycosyl transferase family 1 domain-containing protein n=1 Tax=Bacteroides cellulosilyticus CL02T12C19 TaxID=997874 RepID=I8VPY4_9BACE|nr:glycosyltransferase [Bacteroides cellulosilyticus]EIY28470.1 hypothetical protein HMPREF1062_03455 [Bacteroides cellulosilyticus CL02T12C19]